LAAKTKKTMIEVTRQEFRLAQAKARKAGFRSTALWFGEVVRMKLRGKNGKVVVRNGS